MFLSEKSFEVGNKWKQFFFFFCNYWW